MDGSKPIAISPDALYAALGTPGAPLVVDARREAAFAADRRMLVAAVRRDPEELARGRRDLPPHAPVVVYGADGGAASQATALALRGAGIAARYLDGGMAAWAERGLPLRNKIAAGTHGWITRERPRIDRIACPWLIRRFIDPDASFLYVPATRVAEVAAATGATPFDMPDSAPFAHAGELCSFDAFLRVYDIHDLALDALAAIVRGADTGRPELTPQSPGLLALSQGLSAIFPDDHAMLAHGLTMYDALYASCRSLQGETHDWNPAAMGATR